RFALMGTQSLQATIKPRRPHHRHPGAGRDPSTHQEHHPIVNSAPRSGYSYQSFSVESKFQPRILPGSGRTAPPRG
ncbi:MAG: hypothetical protein KJ622_13505, partial [Alphaproteobacteria bacterium]|nr:hypothetical protein [Alphaproteobacteria bacterium]